MKTKTQSHGFAWRQDFRAALQGLLAAKKTRKFNRLDDGSARSAAEIRHAIILGAASYADDVQDFLATQSEFDQ
jgi:hypothetical protein